jgi:predicted RNase H-like HicB family nuclease
MKKKFMAQIIIEQDESGLYIADCPALKACYAQGRTFEEAIENIKDVIMLCLEDFKGKTPVRLPGFDRLTGPDATVSIEQ